MVHKSINEVFKHFWDHTSIEGLPNAVKSKTIHTKVLWGIGVTACAGMLLWQLSELFIKYFSYLVAINSFIEYASPDFPDVTVCNNYPYDALTQFNLTYAEYLNQLAALRNQVAFYLIIWSNSKLL